LPDRPVRATGEEEVPPVRRHEILAIPRNAEEMTDGRALDLLPLLQHQLHFGSLGTQAIEVSVCEEDAARRVERCRAGMLQILWQPADTGHVIEPDHVVRLVAD